MLSFAANLALVHAAASKLLLSCSCFFTFPLPPSLSPSLPPSLSFFSLTLPFGCSSFHYLPPAAAAAARTCRKFNPFFSSSLLSLSSLLSSLLSLALSLSLSLSVLHYASALASPFAVVWGQLEPGSWSTGGSILSQALNLRASNCIKSVSSDLSLASLPPNSDTPLYPVQFFICLPTPFVVCRSFSHS